MKNNKTVGLVGVVFSLFSVTAFAASNKENMKLLFEMGSEPATACEFPKMDFATGAVLETSVNTCVIVGVGDQPYYFDISRTVRVTPEAGPLIPGRTEEKLVYGDVHLSFDLMEAPKTVGRDLVLNNPIYRSWKDGNNGTTHFVPAQLVARKSGAYVAFRLNIPHSEVGFEDEEYFGYCFGTTGRLF
jgi:hypothetical protein